jgi:EAL domain-containing protein (putative c-di-GMP-specific phosphodiesterase class I)
VHTKAPQPEQKSSHRTAQLAGAEHVRCQGVHLRKQDPEPLRGLDELDAATWLWRTREALGDDRLALYSQPIIPLSGGQPSEQLMVRTIAYDGDVVTPSILLPTAEEARVIFETDRWVIAHAAQIAAQGRRIAVTLSGASIDHRLLAYIASELHVAGADPTNLIVQLTKTALFTDNRVVEEFADGLAELGCGLALDDLGTGLGTLTSLELLPVQYLKVDADFVRDLETNRTNQYVLEAIVRLARRLGRKTIAEGVQDEETLSLVCEYGIDFAQGDHLGRPAPVTSPHLGVCRLGARPMRRSFRRSLLTTMN